jgi:hypothetical protein
MARKRNRKPVAMRAKHAKILERLEALGVGEFESLQLHPLTRQYLCAQDWVVHSARFGESYALTGRGLAALEAYRGRCKKYYDGLCPTCRREPKGAGLGYCVGCNRTRANGWYEEKGKYYKRPEGKCARCDAPRHISAGGFVYPYCEMHQHEMNLNGIRRRYERLKAAMAAGEPVMCKLCGKRPAYVASNGRSAGSYCIRCNGRNSAPKRKMQRMNRKMQSLGIGGRA